MLALRLNCWTGVTAASSLILDLDYSIEEAFCTFFSLSYSIRVIIF